MNVSNVIAINGDWTPRDEDAPPAGSGWIFTHLSYDRVEPVEAGYASGQQHETVCLCRLRVRGGAETTVIDEMGRKTITKSDAMGRLSESIEEDLSTQSGIYSRAEPSITISIR
ncbi:MAG: hypothetical protein KIT57_05020 [Blastocatellales bacterium]|nr:hypothetical protein [Blastocatellales bacterium]